MSTWEWPRSVVTKVVDGDTFDALLTRDLGFGGTVNLPVRLRLNRINAPSVHSLAGKSAKAVTETLLTGIVDLRTTRSYKYGGPVDKVGEYMAEVTLADGRNLSDVLVEGGFAVYWNGAGPRPADS